MSLLPTAVNHSRFHSRSLQIFLSIICGIIAALLFQSVALICFFLVPIQIAISCFGRTAGIVSAISAILLSVFFSTFEMQTSPTANFTVLFSALAPLLLCIAVVAINHNFWKNKMAYSASLCFALLFSLISLPLFYLLDLPRQIEAFLVLQLKDILTKLKEIDAEGIEVATIAIVLDPKIIAKTMLLLAIKVYTAFLFLFFECNWRLGMHIANQRKISSYPTPLYRCHLPPIVLWIFLFSWLAVIICEVAGAQFLLIPVWNLALLFSAIYGLQGLGIIWYLSRRYKIPTFVCTIIIIFATLLIIVNSIGLFLLAGLPLLGIVESWIPFRTKIEEEGI